MALNSKEEVPDWWTPAALTSVWNIIDTHRIEFTRLDANRIGARILSNSQYFLGANHLEAAVRAFVAYRIGFCVSFGEENTQELPDAY